MHYCAILTAMNLRTAPTTPFAQQEHLRLTRHFVDAAATVQASDVSTLDPLRALLRTLLLQELDEYRDAGEFPRNYSHPDNTPVFVDPHGTHCAMGHLIAITGHHELVEHIAATQNFARIKEMTANEELLSWLDAVGLTAQDAAVIQPGYGPFCSSIDRCLCAGINAESRSEPAVAVFDCTIVGTNQNRTLSARVDRVYGTDPTITVGTMLSLGSGEVGTRVLVPVGPNRDQTMFDSLHGRPTPPGEEQLFAGFAVNRDGAVLCPALGPRVSDPPVSVALSVQALTSADCLAPLRNFSPNVSRQVCTGGCYCASPIGVMPPQASITMLLTLVSAIFARRARRSHKPR